LLGEDLYLGCCLSDAGPPFTEEVCWRTFILEEVVVRLFAACGKSNAGSFLPFAHIENQEQISSLPPRKAVQGYVTADFDLRVAVLFNLEAHTLLLSEK